MKKILKKGAIFAAALLILFASFTVIFAENSSVKDEEVMAGLQGAVNPYMAIAAACIAAIVGVVIFIKRKHI